MTTRFLDLVGGNDANDGLSFAGRVQSINQATSGLTASDFVKVMKSPDPVSLGQTASWTNLSDTVSLTSSVSLVIADCDSLWTGTTNITVANSVVRKTGTGSVNITSNGSFTTGKIAYFATGTLDLSPYQKISLWMQSQGTIQSGDLRIDLCSDLTGDVPVNSFTLNQGLAFNTWTPVTLDYGSALGSAIKSISITALNPFVSNGVRVDHVIACNGLTLNSLIGKNSPGELYYTIQSIISTTIKLDVSPNSGITNTFRGGYFGTTESATIYRRETIQTNTIPLFYTSGNNVITHQFNGGVAGSPATISGGWDTTNMSSQTGETWLDGSDGYGRVKIAGTNFTSDKISFVRYAQIETVAGVDENAVLSNCNAIGISGITATYILNSITSIKLDGFTISGGGFGSGFTGIFMNYASGDPGKLLVIGPGGLTIAGVQGNGISGASSIIISDPSSTVKICNNDASGLIETTIGYGHTLRLSGTNVVSNNGSSAFSKCHGLVNNLTAQSNGGFLFDSPLSNLYINKLTTSGNTGTSLFKQVFGNSIFVYDCSISEATLVNTQGIGSLNLTGLFIQKWGNTAGDNRQYFDNGSITTSGASCHGSSTIGFIFAPSALSSSLNALRMNLPPIEVDSGQTITITVWMKPSGNNVIGVLKTLGYCLNGVSETSSLIQGGSGTYQQASITVTPSERGVLQCMVDVYNSSTETMTISDMGVA